ncbi:three-Cys-motif partner protein TcmP [Paenibacillus sp. WQ 127069]|uniref:Three-Cys-motif partner protein TcmP n=1 Tax=Paenibacillus baimaensis TaxID=2982185 RepID=A0ABT2UTI7_9BACL|nr:three-Cys-motif partner protein TcmP [Paenibacillus sp. WQ 127069]MCU6797983.1 three-Cys-motif partner protein TcmP [Paenibacillus sp. WQ 127069]
MSWEMKPHTKAKHIVLENYLKAWFPIMAFTFEKIIYIDGFAGPGKYSSGEDGSPIKALKIASEIYHSHTSKLLKKEFIFVFIEEDKKSFQSLCSEIELLKLPDEFIVITRNGKFEKVMKELLKSVKVALAPTFAFIDPFGTKGVPFDIIKKIMSFKYCEVFFNFMVSGVIRSTDVTDHTDLFGTSDWIGLEKLIPSEKHEAYLDLYSSQLKSEAKVSYIRTFNVRNRKNATIFDLIYATNSETGLDKMKIAMWKADPLGNFTFRDKTDKGQLVLFEDQPDLEPLKINLLNQYSEQTVSIKAILKHVLINTPYLSTHVKNKTLLPLSKSGAIQVFRPDNSKSGFKDGTKIKFNP